MSTESPADVAGAWSSRGAAWSRSSSTRQWSTPTTSCGCSGSSDRHWSTADLLRPPAPTGLYPVAALALAGVLVDAPVALDGACGGDVGFVAGQQDPRQPELGGA